MKCEKIAALLPGAILALILPLAALAEQPAAKPLAPGLQSETLNYNVNWPSQLTLGEAQFTALKIPSGWALSFNLDASVPGYAVSDRFRSTASAELCSATFEKEFAHGKRKSKEKIVFDSSRNVATRETIGGGKTDLPTPACARDALAYIYHIRQELAQGRIPAAQPVFYGAPYQVRLDYTGAQRVRVGESTIEADRIVLNLKGPSSDRAIEIFFARDSVRTPVLVRVPLPLATFSMELVR